MKRILLIILALSSLNSILHSQDTTYTVLTKSGEEASILGYEESPTYLQLLTLNEKKTRINIDLVESITDSHGFIVWPPETSIINSELTIHCKDGNQIQCTSYKFNILKQGFDVTNLSGNTDNIPLDEVVNIVNSEVVVVYPEEPVTMSAEAFGKRVLIGLGVSAIIITVVYIKGMGDAYDN